MGSFEVSENKLFSLSDIFPLFLTINILSSLWDHFRVLTASLRLWGTFHETYLGRWCSHLCRLWITSLCKQRVELPGKDLLGSGQVGPHRHPQGQVGVLQDIGGVVDDVFLLNAHWQDLEMKRRRPCAKRSGSEESPASRLQMMTTPTLGASSSPVPSCWPRWFRRRPRAAPSQRWSLHWFDSCRCTLRTPGRTGECSRTLWSDKWRRACYQSEGREKTISTQPTFSTLSVEWKLASIWSGRDPPASLRESLSEPQAGKTHPLLS